MSNVEEAVYVKGPCTAHEFEAEEYTQEAGANVTCESKIPMEEDKEEAFSEFHEVYDKFFKLHPREQNEILIKVFKERKHTVAKMTKDLDNTTEMYYSWVDGLL